MAIWSDSGPGDRLHTCRAPGSTIPGLRLSRLRAVSFGVLPPIPRVPAGSVRVQNTLIDSQVALEKPDRGFALFPQNTALAFPLNLAWAKMLVSLLCWHEKRS